MSVKKGMTFGFQENLLYLTKTGEMAYKNEDIIARDKDAFLSQKYKKIDVVPPRIAGKNAGPIGSKLEKRRKGAIK